MHLPSDLIEYLDFTRLTENDTTENVLSFSRGAKTPLGNVAAVCVYPEYVEKVAALLSGSDIKIATVCNFPKGNKSIESVSTDIHDAILSGANEIDVVMPYFLLAEGRENDVFDFLKKCRQCCSGDIALKVIIESGELKSDALIRQASDIVIAAGCDFIKTSTGKVPTGATLQAAKSIIASIKNSNKKIGIKISGGIKTPEVAFEYVDLIRESLGDEWLTKKLFRIGASSLLDEILSAEPADQI